MFKRACEVISGTLGDRPEDGFLAVDFEENCVCILDGADTLDINHLQVSNLLILFTDQLHC
jgi:hypothetical protein